MTDDVVIIGAGQTAAVAARTLRRRGFDGPITLIGEEYHVPYQRPPLSKEYLQGEDDRGSLFLLTQQWCAENAVALRLGRRAFSVDLRERAVELDDGSRVAAAALLFATGARPRVLPGVSGDRVHYLRRIEDSEAIRDLLEPGRHLIVIGAGFIGSEVAASARSRGADVTVIEMLGVPLERALGAELGAVCMNIHRRHGVTVRTGEGVESVHETDAGVAVRTASGGVIEGDAVVVGAGVVPNTEVAQRSGLTVDDGIVTDEYCRTAHEGVFAAGDVAKHFHPLAGRHIRVEHFDNANKQGAVAAKNIAGRKAVTDEPPWFWSDQYGLNLQYVGVTAPATQQLVFRGSVDDLDFVAFGMDGEVIRCAFSVERGDDLAIARELITDQVAVDPAALRDEDVDLADLLPDA